jgi:hypothetical protein
VKILSLKLGIYRSIKSHSQVNLLKYTLNALSLQVTIERRTHNGSKKIWTQTFNLIKRKSYKIAKSLRNQLKYPTKHLRGNSRYGIFANGVITHAFG